MKHTQSRQRRSGKLEHQADEIARRSPDKIKSGK